MSRVKIFVDINRPKAQKLSNLERDNGRPEPPPYNIQPILGYGPQLCQNNFPIGLHPWLVSGVVISRYGT